jgi:hypothetical protein
MEPELFHLWQTVANNPYGPVALLAIAVWIVALLPIFYLVYRKRLHPIVVWAILSAGFFGFSQTFPENHSQRGQLAIFAVIGSAVLTWLIVRMMRRERQKRQQSSETIPN